MDSSALLEYFLDSPAADQFCDVIEDRNQLLVPSIVIYEVTRRLRTVLGEAAADTALAELSIAAVAPLDHNLAYAAARIGAEHRLAMADSIIYATAQAHQATLWTQDADFKDLPNVRYFAKAAA
ncbi:type II toxin-antitoxin system VapC family toxin [Opitutaceae bacterium LMO-CP1]|uniref:Ribonuclease VapC n=1 Tax=Synoicihabitans lomoniglobus TaxID=2909285 RepID=A0AAE9ZWI5_9BACT|nr:type II toxin-antitoxin system VapC family toxin [Opitutaceae bacterium LMO-M01]WED65442.1 type II toxin-antitoxin system VapC family toxin [Opitutaceae bacterium LMO-M01]